MKETRVTNMINLREVVKMTSMSDKARVTKVTRDKSGIKDKSDKNYSILD